MASSNKAYRAKDSDRTSARKQNYDMQYADTHLKRVPINYQKHEYELVRLAADRAGQKVGTYIKQAVRERMERENSTL